MLEMTLDPAAGTLSSQDEREMIDALRRGDEAVFRALVEAHHGALSRLAALYVPAAVVDEVVQETWAAVVTGIHGFAGRSSLRTWIYRILLNQARKRGPRERRSIPFAPGGSDPRAVVDPRRLEHPDLGADYWPAPPPAWPGDPEGRALGREVGGVVAAALARLPDAQREVITLRDVEGWTSPEVCDALGISAAHQRVLLHRARAAIRDVLEEYFHGD